MKITKRHLRRVIKEEKAVLEQSWRENPAKIRRQRRIRDRQRMIDQMTFKQLKRRAFDSALFIQGRLDTGQYEYADIWEAEIPGLADTIDAAKVKAAEEGVTYDDIPEVRYQGGILDLSKYSLPGLPAGIEENTMKITESELRQIIKEERARILNEQNPADMSMHDAAEYYEKERATAMGQTARSDRLFDARDNLLGLIEMLKPNEIGPYIDSLIEELEMMKRGA